MTNEEVIARLKQKNWYVKCQNKQDSRLVLQACDEAGITWVGGEKTTECYPKHFGMSYESYPFSIGFHNASCGISVNEKNRYEEGKLENITDWFFNATKNNDGNLIPKLTPQNAEQEHLVQILLAMKQGFYVEVNYGAGWTKATILLHDGDFKYRINPKPTPLPISRWMWRKINKKWRFIAMDKDGQVFLYMKRPHPKRGEYGGYWYKGSAYCVEFPFYINTDGVNWETSLTERPEDV